MALMFCLLIPAGGLIAQVATLDQTLQFKWKGLPVATMDFKVSLPVADHQAMVSSSGTPFAGPKTLIELTGRTRGPLRLVEDYQATVKYVQLDASGKNALTLIGQDNGKPEQREIIFAPNLMPQVSIFEDSTAKNALQPQAAWAEDSSNPLSVFKLMLESGMNNRECAAQTWGYDGKRRYLLRLDPSEEGASRAKRSANVELLEGETARRYFCKITMYSEGQQNAASNAKPSILSSRVAALWPFADGDRELSFDLWVIENLDKRSPIRLLLNEIQVATPLGAIIGKG
ncbi:MAG: hypothetical protein CMP83_08395 [Gammaproteobacteria bacterium]|nr:hypothetical protein [Gammaproteobacteria bacterium]